MCYIYLTGFSRLIYRHIKKSKKARTYPLLLQHTNIHRNRHYPFPLGSGLFTYTLRIREINLIILLNNLENTLLQSCVQTYLSDS